MPTSSSKRTLARRALVEDIRDKKSWLRHGVALAVSILGLGVAGSVALTVQHSTHLDGNRGDDRSRQAKRVAEPARGTERASIQRESRASLISGKRSSAKSMLRCRGLHGQVGEGAREGPRGHFAATRRQAILIQRGQAAPAATPKHLSPTGSGGRGCLPIRSGYSARGFGQVGPWSRYHTGLDFSSPVGTPLHAPADGVVTNAGIGPASGWAGNYVAIKHPNGTHTLLAHMSNVSVRVGQTVSACENVGAVGLTGRTLALTSTSRFTRLAWRPAHLPCGQPSSVAQGPRSQP